MARGLPAEESVKEERRTVGDLGDRESMKSEWLAAPGCRCLFGKGAVSRAAADFASPSRLAKIKNSSGRSLKEFRAQALQMISLRGSAAKALKELF